MFRIALTAACIAVVFAPAVGDARSVSATATPIALLKECSAQDPVQPWRPDQVAELRTTALCLLRAVRRERRFGTVLDTRLKIAALAGLDYGVAVDANADPGAIGKVSRLLDRKMKGRCRRPSMVHFSANDTGANGTIKTPLQLARWVIDASAKPTVTPLLPRFNERSVLFAVVARPGRFGEATSSGAVALLIAGFRCR